MLICYNSNRGYQDNNRVYLAALLNVSTNEHLANWTKMTKKALLITEEVQKWTSTYIILKNHLNMMEDHLWEIMLDLLSKSKEFTNKRKNGQRFKDFLIDWLSILKVYSFMVKICSFGELMLLLIRPLSLLKEILVKPGIS